VYDVISTASFKTIETLQNWYSLSSLIFCYSFHTMF